ncbi:response regulator [Hirschia baltica]|uniref:Response regulator receiver protein n=1 Tax=Hirschia baltica (strain ATCC 49814 / DSM 5838 / IFAM 1418) TaxID=582402 RepID=C6XQ68_HIRBI|nr:response regulator [Hirschia baltica]ACT58585.1 response regulator receiver protein [Hirschia baltica ATCC 49814]
MKIERVLIVDDSNADLFLSELVIKKHDKNIEIQTAYNGREALEILDSLDVQPDIIFLDINMPEMNGHEFLEIYNQRTDQTSVVIMLTSSDQKIDIEKATAYDCVKHFFTKPLDEDDLKMLALENFS